MTTIILASTSPRRKEIFEKLGIPFKTEASSYEEDMTLKLKPLDLAKHLSEGKAKDVAKKHADAIVIGADTFVAYEGKVLGKPSSQEEAKKMLRSYSGNCVSVITGFTIIDTSSGKSISEASEAKVYFKKLKEKDIEEYIASGEPLDKAGAFAVQELGAILIEKIEGDFFNVMGLPLSTIADTLDHLGVNIWELRA